MIIKNISANTLGVGRVSLAPGQTCTVEDAAIAMVAGHFKGVLLEAWRKSGVITIGLSDSENRFSGFSNGGVFDPSKTDKAALVGDVSFEAIMPLSRMALKRGNK